MSTAGVLAGTPTVAGTFSVIVSVTNGGASASAVFLLTILPAALPLQIPGGGGATQLTLTGGTVSVAYSQTLPASNGNPPYSWAVAGGTLPPGLSLAATGTLSGTPSLADPYSYEFTGQVTDSSGATASSVFLIAVAPQPLAITTVSPFPNGIMGSDYPAQILTAVGGNAPYTFQLTGGGLPGGLTFSGGELSGIPTTTGNFTFTVTATDSSSPALTTSAQFQLTIQATRTDLILSHASLALSLNSGATGVPPGANVTVRSSVPGQVLNYSLLVSPAAPWLNVTGGGTTPGSVGINLTSQALTLAAGVHQTSIIVTCGSPSPCAGNTQTINVSVNVTPAAPQLSVTSSLLSFSTQTSNPQPVSQVLGLQNVGGAAITLNSVTAANSFVTISGAPATIPAGPVVPVTVTVNPTGLSAGYYQSTVSVNTSAGSVSVPVTLFLSQNATVTLNPAGIALDAAAGSSPGNTNGSFLVGVSGSLTVNWTATLLPGASWLTLNTSGGSSTSANPGAVSYSINATAAAQLAPGAYYGTIQIASSGVADSPLNFTLVLNVAPAGSPVRPDPAPRGLLFSTNGNGTASAQNVQVFADSALYTTYQASSDSPWLLVSPASGMTSALAPATSSVSVNLNGLTAGVYRGNVSYALSSSVVRTVNVTLIVEAGSAASCVPAHLIPTQTGLANNFIQPAAWPSQVAVTLLNDCGQPVTSGQIIATFSNGDPALPLNAVSTTSGVYSGTWTPRNPSGQVAIVATATAPGFPAATVQIVGQVTPNTAPLLNLNGILDAFAIGPEVGDPVAPGTIVQIYGSNLAAQVTPNSAVPLPTNLGQTSVFIGGMLAPLYYVSPGQINAQVPFELPSGQNYQVIVSANGALSTPSSIQLMNDAPGIAQLPAGQVKATHSDGVSLITETSPASPDEIIVLYMVGMGLTDQSVQSGTASPSTSLAHVLDMPTLTLNGSPVTNIAFAGLTPTAVGLYQINFRVPANAPNGDLQLVVTQTSGQSNAAILPVYNSNAPSLTCPAVTSGEIGVAFKSPAMTVSGGTAPYVFSLASGVLPAGLTLSASTGAISGTPTAAGTFIVQVKDATGYVAVGSCPFTIAVATSLMCPAVSTFQPNVAVNSPAFVVNGNSAPYTFTVAGGTLPAGLTLNTATGAITGTPTATGTFTIQVTDANGVVAVSSCPFTIAPAPLLTCPAVSSGEVGLAFNGPALTVTSGTPPYSFSLASGALPAGLALNASTGAITGTPTASGTFTVQVKDANGFVAASSCPYTIAATPSLSCPAVSAGDVAVALNSPAITVSGGVAPFTFSLASGTLPLGLTLNSSTGAITGTPAVAGAFTIEVTDANGVVGVSNCPFTIAFKPVLTCSAVTSGEVGLAFNSPAMTVTNGAAPFTFSLATGTLPTGLTLNTATGAISGTPTAAGTFTIQVTDATGVVGASSCPFTIAAVPSLTCPAVASGQVGMAFNSPAIAVVGGTPPFTFSVVGTLPPGLTLNSSTGAIAGTPTAVGSFSIQVTDLEGVKAVSVCPFTIVSSLTITTTSLPQGTLGTAYSFQPLISGGTQPFTWTFSGLPQGLSGNTTSGLITGTPTLKGTSSVTISISDSSSPQQTASRTLPLVIVSPPLAITTASSLPNATVDMAYLAQIASSGGQAPLHWSSSNLPAWLTFDITGAGACGAPVSVCGVPTTAGTSSFTITVTDSSSPTAQTASQTFSLTAVTGALGTITVPNVTVGQGLEVLVNIAFSPAPTVGATQCTNSATPGCLTIASSSGSVLIGPGGRAGSGQILTPIGAGTGSVGFYVQGNGASGGGATITVSLPGYANGTSSVTIANSGFVLVGPNGAGNNSFSTYQGTSTTLNVYAVRLDSNNAVVESEAVMGASSINVPIAVSPSSVGAVSPSALTFTGGANVMSTTFQASSVNSGGATIALTQPSGFTAPAAGGTGTLNVTVQQSSLVAPSVTLGQNLEVPVAVSFNGNAPNNIMVTLMSSNASLLQFACITPSAECSTGAGNPSTSSTLTVEIPQGQTQSAGFLMAGYGNTGSVGYSISAPGYSTVQATVPLAPSGLVIQTPSGYGSNFTMPLESGLSAQLNVFTAAFVSGVPVLEAVAVNETVTAAVTSGTTSVGTVANSPVVIGGGSSSATTAFQPVGTGTSTITASAAGYLSASVKVTVNAAALSIDNGATVGKYLESQNTLLLSAPAPNGGSQVTVAVAQSSVGLMKLAVNPTDAGSNSIVLTVPANASSAIYYVYGLASSGTATYTASAPGYGSGTDTVTLAPSGIVITGPANVSLSGGPEAFTIYTALLSTDGSNTPQNPQNLAGQTPVTVAIGNSNPAVGTLPSSVNIAPGTQSSQITFTPVSQPGSTTISVTQPTGWTTPNQLTSSTVNVGP